MAEGDALTVDGEEDGRCLRADTGAEPCLFWRDRQTMARRLKTLEVLARRLAEGGDPARVLAEVCRTVEFGFGLINVAITLLEPDGETVAVEAAPAAGATGRQARFERGEGIIGQVFATGKPAVVDDIRHERGFTGRIFRDRAQRRGVGFVCVPVILGEDVMGTLSADVPPETDEDAATAAGVLSIVAAMLAQDLGTRRTARLEKVRLEAENLRLRGSLGERFRPEAIIGEAKAMRAVYQRIQQVAPSATTVLLRGESGTGKELAATAIHCASPRAEHPFVRVNCAALNENLLESELFGHERGAFTGAVDTRIGRIEEADGGTLFLDEVGEFSSATQVKLLRVLQERQFERVGSNATRSADVRVVCATNRDLEQAVANGSFRQDLYYRINVFPVHLPPLRQRRSDILVLANHFVRRFATTMGKDIHRLSTPAIDALVAYHWPGNVRELENCMEYAVLLAEEEVIHSHHLPPTLQRPEALPVDSDGNLTARVRALERDCISDALKRSGGNFAAAARELGITSRQIRYKSHQLGLDLRHVVGEETTGD